MIARIKTPMPTRVTRSGVPCKSEGIGKRHTSSFFSQMIQLKLFQDDFTIFSYLMCNIIQIH